MAYFDSPCQELTGGGLGIVVALPIRSEIDFLCGCTRGRIKLYPLGNKWPINRVNQAHIAST